jgi:Cytochrome c553
MKRSAQPLLVMAFTLIAGVTIVGYSPTGAVYAAPAATDDDLRATRATAQDVADGKRVAEASCVRCHGVTGISTTKGVPHLAGQRPAYLHLELRAYQSGARGDNAMDNAVKFLSDDALFKVAAYYASLDPPPPSSAKASGQA